MSKFLSESNSPSNDPIKLFRNDSLPLLETLVSIVGGSTFTTLLTDYFCPLTLQFVLLAVSYQGFVACYKISVIGSYRQILPKLGI